MSPNVICSVSLESYHPHLQPQKVSKNPKKLAFTTPCPKSLNSIYGTHRSLRVNLWLHIFKAILELKSMQVWLGQNFTYFYIHNFSEE
jgi:hypothetical protein